MKTNNTLKRIKTFLLRTALPTVGLVIALMAVMIAFSGGDNLSQQRQALQEKFDAITLQVSKNELEWNTLRIQKEELTAKQESLNTENDMLRKQKEEIVGFLTGEKEITHNSLLPVAEALEFHAIEDVKKPKPTNAEAKVEINKIKEAQQKTEIGKKVEAEKVRVAKEAVKGGTIRWIEKKGASDEQNQWVNTIYQWCGNSMEAVYTMEAESGFRKDIVSKPNSNGTKDYGLFQLNSQYHSHFIFAGNAEEIKGSREYLKNIQYIQGVVKKTGKPYIWRGKEYTVEFLATEVPREKEKLVQLTGFSDKFKDPIEQIRYGCKLWKGYKAKGIPIRNRWYGNRVINKVGGVKTHFTIYYN